VLQYPARTITRQLLKSRRKTGPLCSSHLHNGPARLFVARIFCRRKLRSVHPAKGVTDLRCYLHATRFRRTATSFSSWLSSLPSSLSWPCHPPRSQKLARCKSTIDVHRFRLHHSFKIDTARFEEVNDHHTVATCNRTKPPPDAWTQHALPDQDEKKFSCGP
jgi:hypothetical protein